MKDAKTVMQSRAAKSAYVSSGTLRAGIARAVDAPRGPEVATVEEVEGMGLAAPNMRVNWLSLYRHSVMFVQNVARNLGIPAVVALAELELTVEETVSTMFAERYVPV